MSRKSTIRAAAVQLPAGADVEKNLATCLRMLDRAGECAPDLVVLPEFCNHLSWYDDAAHCYRVSLDLDGAFLRAIAAKAQEINAHVVVGVTLRGPNSTVTGSNLLYAPSGELLVRADKQVLIGHENEFLQRAQQVSPVVDTALGRLGLYMCMDGVINETPRSLALRGAQVLCNSLNSFAPDEGSLHIPVRAAENKAFVVAANKVGPLVPEAMMEGISAATHIPMQYLSGAGESQIVAPDGTVLAVANSRDEEVVYADIKVDEADTKCRPDGSDIFRNRRPELYAALAQDPASQILPDFRGADSIRGAVIQLGARDKAAIAEASTSLRIAFDDGATLAVLPALFCAEDADPEQALALSRKAIASLAKHCGDNQYVATSLVLEANGGRQHAAVLIGKQGIVLQQPQVHCSERFAWSLPGDEFLSLPLPFARVAVISSDDAIYPETFRLLALQGVEVVMVPLLPLEAWELKTGLLERAGENRMNILAAARPGALGNSFAGALHEDFTIFGEWKRRQFDGVLTCPILTRAVADPGVTTAELYPRCAANKVVSHRTDLLAGRPWYLLDALLTDENNVATATKVTSASSVNTGKVS